MKAATNRAMITGIFHLRSLLGVAPQFQQARSVLGTILPQAAQGRRGAVVSRPQAPQSRSGAGAAQKGQARAAAPAGAPAPCCTPVESHCAPGVPAVGVLPGTGSVIATLLQRTTLLSVPIPKVRDGRRR